MGGFVTRDFPGLVLLEIVVKGLDGHAENLGGFYLIASSKRERL